MATKDELLALAERCEKADGPDRELDREIWKAADPNWRLWASYAVPIFTTSLDAITALTAEKLPGALWRLAIVDPSDGRSDAFVNGYELKDWCKSPVLALCAAFLYALASEAKP